MVLGAEGTEMKEPLGCLCGGRGRRVGIIGAPGEKPVRFYVEEFRVAWTASTAGKSCTPRCSGISGMVGVKGCTLYQGTARVWTAV